MTYLSIHLDKLCGAPNVVKYILTGDMSIDTSKHLLCRPSVFTHVVVIMTGEVLYY